MQRLILACGNKDCSHVGIQRELLVEKGTRRSKKDDRFICFGCREPYSIVSREEA